MGSEIDFRVVSINIYGKTIHDDPFFLWGPDICYTQGGFICPRPYKYTDYNVTDMKLSISVDRKKIILTRKYLFKPIKSRPCCVFWTLVSFDFVFDSEQRVKHFKNLLLILFTSGFLISFKSWSYQWNRTEIGWTMALH